MNDYFWYQFTIFILCTALVILIVLHCGLRAEHRHCYSGPVELRLYQKADEGKWKVVRIEYVYPVLGGLPLGSFLHSSRFYIVQEEKEIPR